MESRTWAFLMLLWTLLVVPLGIRAQSTSAVTPLATIEKQDTTGTVMARDGVRWTIRVLPDVNQSVMKTPFDEDHHVLVATSPRGREHRLPFYSTYGLFKIDVLHLDADSSPELVLLWGDGRGTSVRDEWLTIYSLGKRGFVKRMETPRSSYFGSGAVWKYEYRYAWHVETGETTIHLTLTHTPIGEGENQFPELIPKEETKTIKL